MTLRMEEVVIKRWLYRIRRHFYDKEVAKLATLRQWFVDHKKNNKGILRKKLWDTGMINYLHTDTGYPMVCRVRMNDGWEDSFYRDDEEFEMGELIAKAAIGVIERKLSLIAEPE